MSNDKTKEGIEPGSLKFHFILLAWGDAYTGPFLDVCLPNHLTPGNLGAFADEPGARFFIYTKKQDFPLIDSHPMIDRLRSLMPIEIEVVDDLVTSQERQTYEHYIDILSSMSKCHNMAIEKANSEGAVQIFLAPDTVMAEGSFARIRELAYAGKRVVSIPQLRVVKERFLPLFIQKFSRPDGFMPSPPRPLTDLALDHLHPLTQVFFHDAPNFFSIFWYLAWRVGEKGILMRCTGFHPLMIYPVNRDAKPIATVDLDYTFSAVPDYNDYYVVTDSDEIVGYEFSPDSKLEDWLQAGKPFNELTYGRDIARIHHEKNRRKALREKVRIHTGERNDQWLAVEKESDELIARTLALVSVVEGRGKRATHLPGKRRTVALYGAGNGLRLAMVLARRCQLAIGLVVDDDPTLWGTTVMGMTITDPRTLLSRNIDLIIIAARSSSGKIAKRLRAHGFAYGDDYMRLSDRVSFGWLNGIRTAMNVIETRKAEPTPPPPVVIRFNGVSPLTGRLIDLFATGVTLRLPAMRTEPLVPGDWCVLSFPPPWPDGVCVKKARLIRMEAPLTRDDTTGIEATFRFPCQTAIDSLAYEKGLFFDPLFTKSGVPEEEK